MDLDKVNPIVLSNVIVINSCFWRTSSIAQYRIKFRFEYTFGSKIPNSRYVRLLQAVMPQAYLQDKRSRIIRSVICHLHTSGKPHAEPIFALLYIVRDIWLYYVKSTTRQMLRIYYQLCFLHKHRQNRQRYCCYLQDENH